MAKKYSAGEAKQIVARYESRKKEIAKILSEEQKKRSTVTKAAEALRETELITFLDKIGVEELSREKTGIRVKLLKENGFETLGAIYTAKAVEITNINGIGEDASALIRSTVKRYAEKARTNIKIKLSADTRDKDTETLLSALRAYALKEEIYNNCNQSEETYGKRIDTLLSSASVEKNALKRLFASKDDRNSAGEALELLDGTLEATYGKQADDAIKAARINKRESPTEIWNLFKANPIPFVTLLEKLCPDMVGSGESVYGLTEQLAADVNTEKLDLTGLKCTLRHYQEWGVKYILHQKRVLLGDEMGLGKTVQAIASMVAVRNAGGSHFLVVCPASVLSNWCREIQKHSDLSTYKIHGDGREQQLRLWRSKGGVGITTYETTASIRLQENDKISMITVDEAHYIKNIEAQRTQNTKKLCQKAEYILFMTGTALENRVDEMVALIKILQPNVATEVNNIAFMSMADSFRNKVTPVYYRRRREEVLTELPELIESKEWCTLSAKEMAVYTKALIARDRTAIRRVSWNMPDIKDSTKAKRLLELVEEAKDDGRKVLIFSFYLDTIQAVCKLLADACYGPITGSVTPLKRQEILDEFEKAPDGSALVAQIQAGGTGLNIQSASVVIICEPQFKPSIENQAISRSYRMGQARSVLVYRLLADNTADEGVVEILESKQKIFDSFADISTLGAESLEMDASSFDTIIDAELKKYAGDTANEDANLKKN